MTGVTVHRPVTATLALLACAGLSATGCGSTSKTAATTTTGTGTVAPGSTGSTGSTAAPAVGSITVSAASSLRGSFTALKSAFEKANPGTTITINFGSSSTLETQIESGAGADEAAFADTSTMKTLADKGLLAAPATIFAKNHLIIVTKPGNPRNIRSLADLAKVGTIALCGQKVPCGRYAAQILAAAGVTVPTSKITRGQDAKATLGAVTVGDADAAIVYVTDAKAAGTKVASVTIPTAQNVLAGYPIGVLKASSHQALARAFEGYVVGPAGQAVLRKAGFLAP